MTYRPPIAERYVTFVDMFDATVMRGRSGSPLCNGSPFHPAPNCEHSERQQNGYE